MLFGAMQTPEDDLFYLSEDSPEWRLLNDHLEVHEIQNPAKYQQQLNLVFTAIM